MGNEVKILESRDIWLEMMEYNLLNHKKKFIRRNNDLIIYGQYARVKDEALLYIII